MRADLTAALNAPRLRFTARQGDDPGAHEAEAGTLVQAGFRAGPFFLSSWFGASDPGAAADPLAFPWPIPSLIRSPIPARLAALPDPNHAADPRRGGGLGCGDPGTVRGDVLVFPEGILEVGLFFAAFGIESGGDTSVELLTIQQFKLLRAS